mmetsp:Transcript_25759/g.77622  ORF Transcript_25759/g.77622 Transcript_25759/m.77622 type:complete len:510 (-) Transcript_25759:15-1544(-)
MSPVVHPPVQSPQELFEHGDSDEEKFDAFKKFIVKPQTTISELFAVLRVWEPLFQERMGSVMFEILKRGGGVNDRDGLTDMTLLHFAAKSGARGMGSAKMSADVVGDLISRGADVNAVCGWTKMTALHYAAFFSCTSVLEVLVRRGGDAVDVNMPCTELEGATPLHMAAMTASADAVAVLLKYGADPTVDDQQGRTALDCVLEISTAPDNVTPEETWARIRYQLHEAEASFKRAGAGRDGGAAGVTTTVGSTAAAGTRPRTPGRGGGKPKASSTPTSARGTSRPATTPVAAAAAGGIPDIGDRVQANGKIGVVRFKGPVDFEKGEWLGIKLERPEGMHNGTVKGREYFRTKPQHGLFVLSHVATVLEAGVENTMQQSRRAAVTTPAKDGRGSKASTPRRSSGRASTTTTPQGRRSAGALGGTPSSTAKSAFGIGSRVFAKGSLATLRYIGSIAVAEGTFLGVEFASNGLGKNDGSLQGNRYFKTSPGRGLFLKPDQVTWRGKKVSRLLD